MSAFWSRCRSRHRRGSGFGLSLELGWGSSAFRATIGGRAKVVIADDAMASNPSGTPAHVRDRLDDRDDQGKHDNGPERSRPDVVSALQLDKQIAPFGHGAKAVLIIPPFPSVKVLVTSNPQYDSGRQNQD
jgi:hypothetical protein